MNTMANNEWDYAVALNASYNLRKRYEGQIATLDPSAYNYGIIAGWIAKLSTNFSALEMS